jgi:hypothetical protein
MAVAAEVVEMVLVTITAVALTVKTVVAVETVVVMIMAAAVYWRRRWFVSSVSDVRIMCNITLICVRTCRPASIYTWIGCLWCIILPLTETMTVPSHPHVSAAQ